VADPDALLPLIRHAGAIFLGHWTPEAIGDYIGGPNHVLPTARSARFSSGLSVMDFVKRTTLARMTPGALSAIGPAAVRLATSESLQAHGLSVQARLDRLNGGCPHDPPQPHPYRRRGPAAPHARDRTGTQGRHL
jgi:histidinol dehydrogenase